MKQVKLPVAAHFYCAHLFLISCSVGGATVRNISSVTPKALHKLLSVFQVDQATHRGYMGGLEFKSTPGATAPYFATSSEEIFFHVSTRMPVTDDLSHKVYCRAYNVLEGILLFSNWKMRVPAESLSKQVVYTVSIEMMVTL